MKAYFLSLVAVAVLLSGGTVACSGGQDDGASADEQDATSVPTLEYGEHTAPIKATGRFQKTRFAAGDGATVRIDVDEAYVPAEGNHELTSPPTDVQLIGPDG